jgi:hypothetical protein
LLVQFCRAGTRQCARVDFVVHKPDRCYDAAEGAADVLRSDEFPRELRDSCRTVV